MKFNYDIIGKSKRTVKLNGKLLFFGAINVLSPNIKSNIWKEAKRLSAGFKGNYIAFKNSIDNANITKMAAFIAFNKEYNINCQFCFSKKPTIYMVTNTNIPWRVRQSIYYTVKITPPSQMCKATNENYSAYYDFNTHTLYLYDDKTQKSQTGNNKFNDELLLNKLRRDFIKLEDVEEISHNGIIYVVFRVVELGVFAGIDKRLLNNDFCDLSLENIYEKDMIIKDGIIIKDIKTDGKD